MEQGSEGNAGTPIKLKHPAPQVRVLLAPAHSTAQRRRPSRQMHDGHMMQPGPTPARQMQIRMPCFDVPAERGLGSSAAERRSATCHAPALHGRERGRRQAEGGDGKPLCAARQLQHCRQQAAWVGCVHGTAVARHRARPPAAAACGVARLAALSPPLCPLLAVKCCRRLKSLATAAGFLQRAVPRRRSAA